MADPNTRQGKRTPVTLKIKFKSETLEQFIERYAVDVSQGGIFIRTKEPLAVGTAMKFEFQLRDASPLIAGEGTVVWTRENDPSRPAIAPGMGVRFDRLAEGSQAVLERILAEKAKQAPQRGGESPTKPPMFTDAPTRVAPAPVQDALLGPNRNRPRSDSDKTPLPKPTPFHSDADEFGAEAFEEATKVRALDELVAATAEGQASGAAEELLRRPPEAPPARAVVKPVRAPSPVPAPAPAPVPVAAAEPAPAPAAVEERDSAPALPEAPEAAARISKPEPVQPAPAAPVPTKLGLEAPRVVRPSAPPLSQPAAESARAARASAQPETKPIESPPPPAKSAAPMVIGLLVVVAAGLAAVWYFVLRAPAAEQVAKEQQKPELNAPVPPAPVPPLPAGSGSAEAVAPAPKGPTVVTEIAANAPNATVTVVDTGDSGPAPFKAKLEKDKHYKVRVEAAGFVAQELDVTAGQDQSAKLVAKPHVLSITSTPPGAGIAVDNYPIGHLTPFEYQLSAAQAAKPKLRITLRKTGFKAGDAIVDSSEFHEDDKQLAATVEIKLAPAPVVVHNPATTPTPTDAGTGTNGANGSDTTGTTPDNGGQTPPTTPTPSTDTPPATPPPATPPPATTPPPSAPAPSGSASASAEPTPSWAKPN